MMHFAQDVNKIALDDQQTLALNELLLQLEDVKRTLHGVTSDNEVLRSEVSAGRGGGEVKAAAGPGAVHNVISRCHQSRGGQLGTRRGLDRRDHAAQIIRITRANYYDYKHYAARHHDY